MASSVAGIDDCLDELVLSLLLQPSDIKSFGCASQTILQRCLVPWRTPHTDGVSFFIQSDILEGCILEVPSQFGGCGACACCLLHCSGQQLVEQIFFSFVVVLVVLVAKADAIVVVVVGVDAIDEVVGVVAVAELLLAVAMACVEWRSVHICEFH